ncbi:MAG: putative bifunctional diguanylate cyclase/phosphodiesterase [Beijerinckiaceae bacterium]
MESHPKILPVTTFRALFQIPTDNPGLMQSQVKALSAQVPLLYFIVFMNTVAVAWTHYGIAPDSLTIGFPIIVLISGLIRGWAWMQSRGQAISNADASRRLEMSVVVSGAFGVMFLAWGLGLYQYGDAYAQGHVAFYMAITVISSIFCMMHLRPAALLLTGVTVIPFTIFFLATGRPVFIAIALNMLLVSAAMVYILLIHSRDFANMIDFQKRLIETHNELVEINLETKRLSDENLRLANLDSLTDLPNRRQFFTRLHAALHSAARDETRFVVGMIDLDGFKAVNDVYGHTTGDKLLVEAGRRMQEICHERTFLARLGGDEFGVIIEADADDAGVIALGNRLCGALDAPFTLPGIIAQVSGSAGFATFPEAGSSAELLFERADYALYHAKQHLRGHPVIFSSAQETEIRYFGNVEQGLRNADLESEMSLNFQPIFDVERGEPVAFEALARWDSPKLGRVRPDIFVRVAERSDIVNKLTRVLLRKALANAKTWPCEMRVSFNLSVRDLASDEAILAIVTIIENSGVAPGRIDLEVTETALMRDFDQSSKSLRMLKALGVGISLDDFGTGYSSLSFVHRLPIDKIKIDRSFIQGVETEASCRAIVKTIIDLCRNLKLTCVAEGMEADGQARILRSLGCTMMQGYLFGTPMPAREVLDFLTTANSAEAGHLAVAS